MEYPSGNIPLICEGRREMLWGQRSRLVLQQNLTDVLEPSKKLGAIAFSLLLLRISESFTTSQTRHAPLVSKRVVHRRAPQSTLGQQAGIEMLCMNPLRLMHLVRWLICAVLSQPVTNPSRLCYMRYDLPSAVLLELGCNLDGFWSDGRDCCMFNILLYFSPTLKKKKRALHFVGNW